MKLLKIASALAFTALAASAQAAIIPSFSYFSDGGFINSPFPVFPIASSCVNGAGNPITNAQCNLTFGTNNVVVPVGGSAAVGGFLDGQQTHLSVAWGTPSVQLGSNPLAEQSSLNVVHNAGNVITNGGWALIDTFTHINRVIQLTQVANSTVGYMNSTPVYGGFHFTAPILANINGTSPLFFLETTNVNPSGCLQTPNPLGTTCDDLYTTAPLDGDSVFTVGGQDYLLQFRFRAVSNAIILDLNPMDPFVNVFCGETNDCQIVTEVRVSAIPEPGALALVGLSLAGLAVIRRRKSQAAA